MKIIKLETENVKRIKAIEITPKNNTIIIGGKNGAGKSSILDSIMMALGGKKTVCDKPLREGEKKGKTILNLGKYVVTRTYTPKGGTLKVENSDGASYSSPQKILDEIIGNLTFDPIIFSNLNAKEQLDTIKNIVGLDFADLNNKYDLLYNERTEINKEGKEKSSLLNTLTFHENIEKIDISLSIEDLQNANDINNDNDEKRKSLVLLSSDIESEKKEQNKLINDHVSEIEKLKSIIKDKEKKHKELMISATDRIKSKSDLFIKNKTIVDNLKDIDILGIKEKLKNAESNNKKITDNETYNTLKESLKNLKIKKDNLNTLMKDIIDEKSNQMSKAKFPIKGLGFDDSGVIFNDQPFSQASSAEKLKVAISIGIAMNPKLKIMLIRDASLLDEDNMKMIEQIANDSNCQLWIERVGDDGKCSVVIEDGEIK